MGKWRKWGCDTRDRYEGEGEEPSIVCLRGRVLSSYRRRFVEQRIYFLVGPGHSLPRWKSERGIRIQKHWKTPFARRGWGTIVCLRGRGRGDSSVVFRVFEAQLYRKRSFLSLLPPRLKSKKAKQRPSNLVWVIALGGWWAGTSRTSIVTTSILSWKKMSLRRRVCLWVAFGSHLIGKRGVVSRLRARSTWHLSWGKEGEAESEGETVRESE